MLIDFLKGRPCCRNLRRATSPSLRVSGVLPPLRSAPAPPPSRCGGYRVSRRGGGAAVNNRLWGKYTDHGTDGSTRAAEHVSRLRAWP